MAITASGVGSGLDIENIVSQLMTLERQPLVALQRKESDYQAQLSSYGRLKSAISSFKDAMGDLGDVEKFKVFSSTSSNEDVLTATTSSAAAGGIYGLDITRLAQNHKMGSSEFAPTDTIGGGAGDAITITVDGSDLTVDMSSAMTLAELRDAINDDDANPGVTASLLNTGDNTQRLILTSNESGYDKRMELTYGGTVGTTLGFGTVNRDANDVVMVDLTELDAAFTVDGFDITADSNKASGVIDGITLELKQVGAATLKIDRDTETIKESAQALVDAYNQVDDTIKSLRNGNLSGDSTLLSIQRQMRNLLNEPPVGLSGSYSSLSEVGIKTNAETGALEFTASDFEDALDQDFSGVSQLFANDDQGYAFRFAALADSMLDTDGLLDAREDGINDRIDDLKDGQDRMELRLELKEKALRAQYAALDSLVGQLNSTSSFLLQQLGS